VTPERARAAGVEGNAMASANGPEVDELSAVMWAQVQSELAPGECLIWAGRAHLQPGAQQVVFAAFWGVFGLGLVILGIALFKSLLFKPRGQGDDLHSIIGVAAAAMGAFLLLVTVVLALQAVGRESRARRTCYALTNRRAIVWRPPEGSSGTEVRSFWPADFNALFRVDHGDGSGDLIFHEITVVIGLKPQPIRQGFLGIRRVRHVEALLRETLLGPRLGPASEEVFAP
jgi:hypothetical protein